MLRASAPAAGALLAFFLSGGPLGAQLPAGDPGPGAPEGTPAGASPASLGPLRSGEKNPLYRLFYVPVAEPADGLERGRFRVEVLTSYSNICQRSEGPGHDLVLDLERMTNTLGVRYGVSERVELGLALPFQTNWGGFLDGFIRRWHHWLHLPDGSRDRVGDGLFTGYLADGRGERRHEIEEGAFVPEDLRVLGKVRLGGGPARPWTLSARGVAKLPTGHRTTGTGRGDVAVEALGRGSRGGWHLHGMLGVTTLSAPGRLEDVSVERAALWWVALERSVAGAASVVAQVGGSGRYLEGFGVEELDRPPTILTLGALGRAGDWTWEASFSEDVPANGPSVDFTVDVRVARTW